MPPTDVRFYFDYVSPNAYLAWTQLPLLVERFGVDVVPVPVLFAGLLDAQGRVGPAEVPDHIRWMWKNVLRKATILSVPFNRPASHPFNPLLALRVSSLPLSPAERVTVIDALFQAVWVLGLDVSDPRVVGDVLDGIGVPGAALVAQAQEVATKDRLRKQTDDAIARSVFGVPSMEVGDELFWGYDDFPYLALYLDGDDPLDPAEWAKWSEPLVPSAVRPRRKGLG